MAHEIPTTLEEVENLPISTYWNEGAKYEFITSDLLMHNYADRLNLTRHLFVNGVPLYFVSIFSIKPVLKWIRRPFETLTDGLLYLSHLQQEGNTLGRIEFSPITELNELHRTYDEDGNEIVHDYTNWVARGYQTAARMVFHRLSVEHQEKLACPIEVVQPEC